MLKYISYNRKSSESEDKQILSIASQEEATIEMAQRGNLFIYRTISESKSAKVPKKRKGFGEMTRLIKAGKANAIMCWKLDRLARNMEEGGEIIELLQQGKIQEIRTPAKTYTPMENVLMLAVEFGFANQYSRDLSVNVKRGQRKKAQMGIPHGLAPFGFLNRQNEDRSIRYWVVDEERFEMAKNMFRKILDGTSSIRSVYFWLIENYQPTTVKRKRLGGQKLSQTYFYLMLRNPIYAGFFVLEGQEYELEKSLPRAVTRTEFAVIQKMLDHGIASPNSKHVSHYSGIILAPDGSYIGPDTQFQLICDCKHKFAYLHRTHCPRCGIHIHDIVSPRYLVYTYYYNVKLKKRREKYKTVSESIVEAKVREFISAFYFTDRLKDYLRERVNKVLEGAEGNLQPIVINEKQLEKLEGRKKSLRKLLVDSVITLEEYQQDVADLEREILDIHITISGSGYQKPQDKFEGVLNIYEIMVNQSKEDKILLLRKLGSNLIWNEKNLYINSPDWVLEVRNAFIELREKTELFQPDEPLDLINSNTHFRGIVSRLVDILLYGSN